ncbi:MAG TPA: carbohydrate ABC transporter permease [Candidatus Eisenbergiella merdavium]|uniref:Carbohydrate ABC transporter permease n=1 Tax=Candidatus Eisenbergiella merdavium TaxID=2838551 RepID=A0A9D2SPE2_9FIRM|nr:carbohydrate ABC transporter permease [Candidatus Eisenbergiella merdavium]
MKKNYEERTVKKYKWSKENVIFDGIVWSLLILIFIVIAYPFYYVVIASFNDGYDFMKGGIYFFPRKFTLYNYVSLLSQEKWIRAFQVSFFRTVLGTCLTVLATCLVSYALSRKELAGGKVYRFLVIFAMYVSGGLIPYYITLRNLQLLNTVWVYIIPSMLNLFFIMVGINFFASIPISLIESAKLDGASEFRIFFSIVRPVSTLFIATLALFSAVNQWSAWLDSAYYVNSESLRTVAYRMLTEINQTLGATSTGGSMVNTSTALTTQASAMVVSMLPIMCVYPFLQKYFVQGIMIGAVKE